MSGERSRDSCRRSWQRTAVNIVAVHDGKVVASGADKVAVAREAYDRVGYVTVYLGHVDDLPRRPIRLASARLLLDEGPPIVGNPAG